MGIKKLSKNKYQARYFAGYTSKGKRVYPSKTFKTRKDANTWLTAKQREKHLGEYAESATLSLEHYLDQWLIAKKPSLKENTLYTYKNLIEQYVRREIGHMKLNSIKPHHIEQWQATLLNRVSPRTVYGVRATLRSALQRAVRQQLISRNPVRDAESVKPKRTDRLCFEPAQAIAFQKQCQGPLGLWLKFMLSTGLRPEEMAAIRWSDLDLDSSRTVKVVRSVLRIAGGGWRFAEPKTKNSVRKVGIPSWLIAELREYRKQQLEMRMKVGRHYKDYDLVFTTGIGTPLTETPIRAEFKATLKRAGLSQTMRVYDLRHSFVTLSLAAGVDLKTVSEEAGHATVAFTLDNYGHVLKVMRDAAAEKREAFWAAHGGS